MNNFTGQKATEERELELLWKTIARSIDFFLREKIQQIHGSMCSSSARIQSDTIGIEWTQRQSTQLSKWTASIHSNPRVSGED